MAAAKALVCMTELQIFFDTLGGFMVVSPSKLIIWPNALMLQAFFH